MQGYHLIYTTITVPGWYEQNYRTETKVEQMITCQGTIFPSALLRSFKDFKKY